MSRTLSELTGLLERLAPLELAQDWDNVGLLIEPSAARARPIERVLLCIDLDERVLDEALSTGADFLVAYHPPIFRPVKRLCASSAEERLLLRIVEAGLALYSPHTALDAAEKGVNHWLSRAFGAGRRVPLAPRSSVANAFKVVVFVPRSHVAELRSALSRELGAGQIGDYSECSYETEGVGSFLASEAATPSVGERGRLEFVNETRLEMRLGAPQLKHLARVIAAHHPYEEPAWDVYPLAETAARTGTFGGGLRLELDTPISLGEATKLVKAHLGVATLRVAMAGPHAAGAPISTVALCAGAGGSAFEKVSDVDLFVTGEMRHHDVLARVRAGKSVILSEHTHTERGFLPDFAGQLAALAGGELTVQVSELDRDPLCTV